MATARKAKTASPSRKRKAAATAAPDLAAAFRQTYAPPVPAPNPVITLDADVATHFRDSRAVNEALRALLRIVKQVRV